MKSVLLIGLGRFGRYIAMKLNEMKHEVMAIDSDEERVNAALSFVTNAQIGDSTSKEFLSTLGIRNFDVCIVTIGDNFQNSLETTDLLRELGAQRIIARASRGLQEKFLLRSGADEVVYPEKQLAAWTAIRSTSNHILDYIELDRDCSIFELIIPEKWHDQTILQLNVRQKYGINILGIRENGKLNTNIAPETVLRKGEIIVVLGNTKGVQKCFHV